VFDSAEKVFNLTLTGFRLYHLKRDSASETYLFAVHPAHRLFGILKDLYRKGINPGKTV